jgi:hypothetical protein
VTYTVAVDVRVEAGTPADAVLRVKNFFAQAVERREPTMAAYIVQADVWPYVEG